MIYTPQWLLALGHKAEPDTSFKQSDAMYILIALHWLVDSWKIYLFLRQLAVANNTVAVPAKLQEFMTLQNYDLVRRQSRVASSAMIVCIAILLIVKTFKLHLCYHFFIWNLSMHLGESLFWRAVLYAAFDIFFSQLITLPISIFATLMTPDSSPVRIFGICIESFGRIVAAAASSAATIASLMVIIEFYGPALLLYFIPISNATALLLMTLYIQYIAPIRYRPIDNEITLQIPIKRLTNVVGYPSSKVFIDPDANAAPNAYFIGALGKSMITISRSLINILNLQQVTAVVAHELGHWSKQHNIIHMFFSVLEISIFSIGLAYSYDNHVLMEIFSFGEDKPHPIITLYLWHTYLSPLISDLLNGMRSVVGRFCEFYADDFARDLGLGPDLKRALLMLASKSTAYPIFDSLFSAWFLGHPTILERVSRIEGN